jgi:hypothetical protein
MIDETQTRADLPATSALSMSQDSTCRLPCPAGRIEIVRQVTSSKDREAAMADDRQKAADAESVAIAGLGFVAADPELLPRFLAITGIEAQSIRKAASEPGFLAGVLNFILAHEPTLMRFCEETGIEPARVAGAIRRLPLGDDGYQTSA